MEKREQVKDVIETLTTSEKISIWNEFASANSWDTYLYNMSEFDDLNQGSSPLQILRDAEGNDFKTYDDYYYYDWTGLNSTSDGEEVFDWDAVAIEVVNDENDFECCELRELIEEWEEQEEEKGED